MRQIKIGSKNISDDSDCFVIAEIGHNHQGDLETAKQMCKMAKECGADAAKLQKRNNRELFTQKLYNTPYENPNSYGATYGKHRDFLEFDDYEYRELAAYADKIGLVLFSTAFDFSSADFLAGLGMPAFKIASGDLLNTPLLKHIASFEKPIIMSTGGGTMEDVRRAYDAVMPINPNLCILQCTAGYPADTKELNLRVIETFRQCFPENVIGLSSHDNGIVMPVAAYMLGARVIEKHFTLNHTWKGTDHAFSLEPIGFGKMVRDLRRVRTALGNGIKKAYDSEIQPMIKMGKKIVAKKDIFEGSALTMDDIAIKSPGDGLKPYEIEKVLGRVTTRKLKKDDDIIFSVLNGYKGQ